MQQDDFKDIDVIVPRKIKTNIKITQYVWLKISADDPLLGCVEDINIFHGGNTALHVAVRTRLRDVVEYIISRNELDINMRTNGKWTALHEATKTGRLDIIKTLLDNGADVGAKDESGQTPLHWAVRFHTPMDLV
ncbi:putative ankyrin repeat protein RF_0381 [Coccinella septempunctata]|uniref:putative ankyrin repeat protein RF_0381 n=1 Tax=Coccinella septempunctata TaxID=41139 RepID=UPI001D06A730|nr:putative ankyrin repeat protein RF_0381 [Coccinella septempunctata]